MTNWRDATFPEAPGKILNMGRDGGKKESESSNYSNFPLPAKITDGASHTQILIADYVHQEAGENQPIGLLILLFGKVTTHSSFSFRL